MNTVSLPGYKRPIDDMMKQATSELADEFPYNEDTNSGRNIGFGERRCCYRELCETALICVVIRFDTVHYQKRVKEQLLNFISGSPISSTAEFECSSKCSSNKTAADRNPWIS